MVRKMIAVPIVLATLLLATFAAIACRAHAQAGAGGEWFVIAGSFDTQSDALRHAKKQKSAGLTPIVEESRLYPLLKPGLWVVIAGKFRTQDQAANYASLVKSKGFASYIKRAYSP